MSASHGRRGNDQPPWPIEEAHKDANGRRYVVAIEREGV